MGKSGYFARKCMLLASDIKLKKKPTPCSSVHSIRFDVKTSEHLKRLIGRMYKLPYEREFKILKPSDTHVIGEKILVKSPLTCASDKGICIDCYGPELFHTNKDGVGIGAYAGAIITMPVSQSVNINAAYYSNIL